MFTGVSSGLTAVLAIAVIVAGREISDQPDDRRGRGMMFGWHMMEGGKRSCAGLNGRPGVCMGQNECAEMSGKSVGKCFPFDSCCSITSNSCGTYSGSSTSYFQSPDKFQESCTHKINVRRNVCQIRIDFEKFTLDQPTIPNNGSAYACERDEFAVFSNDNMKMNVPVLCGENSGQHVYVPVKEQTSSDLNNRHQVTLKFQLTPRDEDYTAPEPLWKIKITQLECPATSTNWWKIKDIAREIWDKEYDEDEEDEEDEKEERKETFADKSSKYSLAPDGCLQYFTDKEGSFESFNYNKGTGHYLGNLNYVVCFKRNHDTCGIKYEAVKFQTAHNRRRSNATDRDCDTADEPETTTAATPATTLAATTASPQQKTDAAKQTDAAKRTDAPISRSVRRKKLPGTAFRGDYLLVPDGLYSERYFASKYCGRSLEDFDYVTVKTGGPLYAAFVSDGYTNPNDDTEKGYKIDYSLMNSGC